MSPFLVIFLVVLLLLLFFLWPLIRQVGRIRRVHHQARREYRRRQEEATREAARTERAQKSSAEILREAHHDLDGGDYVDYEEVDERDRTDND